LLLGIVTGEAVVFEKEAVLFVEHSLRRLGEESGGEDGENEDEPSHDIQEARVEAKRIAE
jgi:hypothetical protein